MSRIKRNKNRRRDYASHTWALPVRFVFPILFVIILTVPCVLLKNSCEELQSRIADEEIRQKELRDEFTRVNIQWHDLVKLENLEKQLMRHGILMSAPGPGQIQVVSTSSIRFGAGTEDSYAVNQRSVHGTAGL